MCARNSNYYIGAVYKKLSYWLNIYRPDPYYKYLTYVYVEHSFRFHVFIENMKPFCFITQHAPNYQRPIFNTLYIMTFLVAERMAFSYHPLKKAQFKHQCPFSYKSYLAFKKHILMIIENVHTIAKTLPKQMIKFYSANISNCKQE